MRNWEGEDRKKKEIENTRRWAGKDKGLATRDYG